MRFVLLLLVVYFSPFNVLYGQSANTSNIVIADIPKKIEGVNTTSLLWGRHNQKYVRVGNYRYAVLQKKPIHPRDIVIYKFNEANPSVGWVEAWAKSGDDAHQSPSIYVEAISLGGISQRHRLHLIYPKEAEGTVIHYTFSGSDTGQLALEKTIDTSIWGGLNYYFGTVYDSVSKRIYLCSNNWIRDSFRCGVFQKDRWYTPREVLHLAGHRYLYPTMYAWGHQFWVAVSAHKNGKKPNGSREVSTVRRMSHYGAVQQYHTTLGNNSIGNAMFENDLAYNETNQKIYVVGNYTEGRKQLYLYIHDLNSGFEKKRVITGARGSSFNVVVKDNKIFAIGAGMYFVSADEGVTWTRKFYESSFYPKSEYAYTLVSTMKPKSGSEIHPDKILILQEVRERSTGLKSVVSIDLLH